jgi:hypothetical protein
MSRKIEDADDIALAVARSDMARIHGDDDLVITYSKSSHLTPSTSGVVKGGPQKDERILTADYSTVELRNWAADTGVFSTDDLRLPGMLRRQAE